MTPSVSVHGARWEAALRLHGYLERGHWRSPDLIGPDPGVRWNYRVGRFVKSALRQLRWGDDLVYLQGLGYWVIANVLLAAGARQGSFVAEVDPRSFERLAATAADGILARQDDDGGWPYPNPEWRGRVATAEGTWASLGLIAAFRVTGERRYLDGALRWHAYVGREIGFQRRAGTLAVQYFAHRRGPRIPNNTAFYLRFLAELAEATGDHDVLAPCEALVAFLDEVQSPSGEFPYSVEGDGPGRLRAHFQCFQYNAYMTLDLLRYAALAADAAALAAAARCGRFLVGGIGATGAAAYACSERDRTVTYHTAVVASALEALEHSSASVAASVSTEVSTRAFRHVLDLQRSDGSFPHSRGDYRVLRDDRAYPRYLAMLIVHLVEHLGPGVDVASPSLAGGRSRATGGQRAR